MGDEELWVVGGSVSASQPSASRPDDRLPMNSCWSYNVRTKEWRALPPLNQARDACTAECVGGRVWVMGGVGAAAVESIDAADQGAGWRVEGAVPDGFDPYSPACVLGGAIYFHGNQVIYTFKPLVYLYGGFMVVLMVASSLSYTTTRACSRSRRGRAGTRRCRSRRASPRRSRRRPSRATEGRSG